MIFLLILLFSSVFFLSLSVFAWVEVLNELYLPKITHHKFFAVNTFIAVYCPGVVSAFLTLFFIILGEKYA